MDGRGDDICAADAEGECAASVAAGAPQTLGEPAGRTGAPGWSLATWS